VLQLSYRNTEWYRPDVIFQGNQLIVLVKKDKNKPMWIGILLNCGYVISLDYLVFVSHFLPIRTFIEVPKILSKNLSVKEQNSRQMVVHPFWNFLPVCCHPFRCTGTYYRIGTKRNWKKANGRNPYALYYIYLVAILLSIHLAGRVNLLDFTRPKRGKIISTG